MQPALIQLSGPNRGQVEVFDEDPIRIGTDSSNDLVVDPGAYPVVAPFLAEIRREAGNFLLTDIAGAGVWVNDQKVSETFLAPGDSFQLGQNGPQFRFRTCRDNEECKTLRLIVADSRAIARAEQAAPLVSATTFLRFLVRDLVREASWGARVTAAAIFLVTLTLAAGVPFAMYSGYRTSQETRQAVGALRLSLKEERISRDGLATRLEAERERIGRQQEAVATLQKERERLLGALQQTESKLHLREAEERAGERLIARFAGGVALVQGALSLVDPQGHPVRYAALDDDGQPRRDPSGRPLLSPDGKGPVATMPFSGTAFLVSRDGLFVTNRHVVEPWRGDESLEGLLAAGYTPRMTSLRAFVPGIRVAVPLTVVRVSDDADVALIRGDLKGARVPVLALDHSGRGPVPGRPVLLMGYPRGLEALMARADPATVQRLMAEDIPDEYALADRIAALDLIRPSITQGLLADVQPHQVTYDALTTGGGSGGPVLSTDGKVIAINYAVLQQFAGSNFGIPARFAVSLLETSKRSQ
ncbi:MAG: trypsin-like peptidase domain-containing protein [candidate division NC10 bacterium]|nr:trypsin-like peptidase domain-containing protein [candidate division NC10 bacterium]